MRLAAPTDQASSSPMNRNLLLLALLAAPMACSSAPPSVEAPASTAAATPPPVETVAATPPPAATTAPVAEPTAEEKKKAEDKRQLDADRAQFEAEMKAELPRWTPELHAEAKALAAKTYPNAKAALDAVLKGKHRKPGHPERDKDRHPAETLTFFGFKPTMTVFEFGPGEGWFTELLAPALAAKGKLIVNTTDPNGPPEARGTFYAQRLQRILGVAPELFGKVESIVVESAKPDLKLQGTVDLALVFRSMHGWHNNKLTATWLAEIHEALKPNGVLGIEQHRAKDDANPDESSKKGYLPEAFVIKEVEAAGFKLQSKSEVNANPRDTKDYAEGVWALPPTFRMKDKDHDKYAAIGESDRMTLKFVKVTAKPAKK
jgi:predicted methyltransferase